MRHPVLHKLSSWHARALDDMTCQAVRDMVMTIVLPLLLLELAVWTRSQLGWATRLKPLHLQQSRWLCSSQGRLCRT
jgi:hypothetical protein